MVARMSLTGVGCRLQTCSRLASERFDSAFCATNFFEWLSPIYGVIHEPPLKIPGPLIGSGKVHEVPGSIIIIIIIKNSVQPKTAA